MTRIEELELLVSNPECSLSDLLEYADAMEVRDITPERVMRDINPEPIIDRAPPEVLERTRAAHETRQDHPVTMETLDTLVEVIAEEMRALMAEENAYIRNELKKLRDELILKTSDERMALRATIEQPWKKQRRERTIQ